MFWRVLHDTLKWIWPALFGGAVAVITIAVASAQVWPEARDAVGELFTAAITVLNNPWPWALLFAVFVVWLAAFIWSGHKLAAPNELIRDGDMPLYLACRWIARDSAWAARLHPSRDNQWVALVDAELMSKVNLGRVELFGVPRDRGGAMFPLPKEFTDQAQWQSHNLVTGDPPTHMWASVAAKVTPSLYYDIRLNSRQVRAVWPARSVWARLLKRSPVERLDYGEVFERQDAAYRQRNGDLGAPLEALLREANASAS